MVPFAIGEGVQVAGEKVVDAHDRCGKLGEEGLAGWCLSRDVYVGYGDGCGFVVGERPVEDPAVG